MRRDRRADRSPPAVPRPSRGARSARPGRAGRPSASPRCRPGRSPPAPSARPTAAAAPPRSVPRPRAASPGPPGAAARWPARCPGRSRRRPSSPAAPAHARRPSRASPRPGGMPRSCNPLVDRLDEPRPASDGRAARPRGPARPGRRSARAPRSARCGGRSGPSSRGSRRWPPEVAQQDRPRTPASGPRSRRRRCRGGRDRRGRACPAPSRCRPVFNWSRRAMRATWIRWVSSAGVAWRRVSSGRMLARIRMRPVPRRRRGERTGRRRQWRPRPAVRSTGDNSARSTSVLQRVDPQLAIGIACRQASQGVVVEDPAAVAAPRGRARAGGPARRSS